MKNISICIFLLVLNGDSITFAVDAFAGAKGSSRLAAGGRGGAADHR